MRELLVQKESWPLAKPFVISRGAKTVAEVVVATVREGDTAGRGECVPYARYGETVDGVVERIEALAPEIGRGMDRAALHEALPAGAARNALDCALWDFQARRDGASVVELAGLDAPEPVVTAYTLGLDTAQAMGAAARAESRRPLIKLKLAGEGDLERVAAVRENAPDTRLIVDANEGWTPDMVEPFAAALGDLGVVLIEQPLPAGDDSMLAGMAHPVPFCADESCHDRAGLEDIAARYDCINIKLDKTGGLTEALALKRAAEAAGLTIMAGCMVATSLAMAPALLIAQGADFVDLDGPLLLARDREGGLIYQGSTVAYRREALWG